MRRQIGKTWLYESPVVDRLWIRNLKLLDSLVAGIGDVELAVAVEGHAVGFGEFAPFAPGIADKE